MKEEVVLLLKNMSAYKIDKQKVEMMLPEKEVAMKAIIWSLMGLEKSAHRLKTSDKLPYCFSQTALSDCQTTDSFLKNNLPVYIGCTFHVKKTILMHCTRQVFELVLLVVEVIKNGKRRSVELQKMAFFGEDRRCLHHRWRFWKETFIRCIRPQFPVLIIV